jgi:hypothetical protein
MAVVPMIEMLVAADHVHLSVEIEAGIDLGDKTSTLAAVLLADAPHQGTHPLSDAHLHPSDVHLPEQMLTDLATVKGKVGMF